MSTSPLSGRAPWARSGAFFGVTWTVNFTGVPYSANCGASLSVVVVSSLLTWNTSLVLLSSNWLGPLATYLAKTRWSPAGRPAYVASQLEELFSKPDKSAIANGGAVNESIVSTT